MLKAPSARAPPPARAVRQPDGQFQDRKARCWWSVRGRASPDVVRAQTVRRPGQSRLRGAHGRLRLLAWRLGVHSGEQGVRQVPRLLERWAPRKGTDSRCTVVVTYVISSLSLTTVLIRPLTRRRTDEDCEAPTDRGSTDRPATLPGCARADQEVQTMRAANVSSPLVHRCALARSVTVADTVRTFV
jgi:hypothetical protein